MGHISEKGLRDYAFRVLKSELGEHVNEFGIIVPAKYTDEHLAAFAANMTREQLDEMYGIIYKSEMVE